MILLRVSAESRGSFAALQDDRAFRDRRGGKKWRFEENSENQKAICESPLFSPIPQNYNVIPKRQRGISRTNTDIKINF
jgi:hypothetical protein